MTTKKLYNRGGRGEFPVEGHDYLNVGGQFTSGENHKYITTGGHLTTIEVGPKPEPIVYTIELPDTVNGRNMYKASTELGDEVVYAPVLTEADNMFAQSSITSFKGDLPSATSTIYMFQNCTSLTSFESDIPNVGYSAYFMFNGCTSLTSFKCNMPSAKDCGQMFKGCSNLSHVECNFASLQTAREMFSGCKLDKESVDNILETINPNASHYSITIGVDSTQVSELDQAAYAITFAEKGWTVEWERN